LTTTPLDILIRAKDEASRVINGVASAGTRLDGTMTGAAKKTGFLARTFGDTGAKIAKVASAAYLAHRAFDFGADLIHSSEQAQAATRQAFALIRKDADHTGVSLSGLSDWAEMFGDKIGQDDEQIKSLAAKITQSFDLTKMFGKGNEGDGLTSLTQGVIDFSAATGKAQSMSVRLFNTIANSPATALSQLQKLGVITQEQTDHYKKLIANGHAAAVSTELLGLVTNKYEGAAEKGATSSEKLHAVWQNLKETLGGFLLPMFEKLAGWLSTGLKWFQDLISGGSSASGMFAMLGKKLGPVVEIGSSVWDTFKRIWGVLQKNLVPSIMHLFKALSPVLKIVGLLAGAIIVGLIKTLPVVVRLIAGVINIVAGLVSGIGKLITWIGRAVGWVKDKFVGAWQSLKDILSGLWDGVVGAAKTGLNFIIDGINKIITGMNFAIDLLDKAAGPFINFGEIPHIPHLAEGGIVTRPTLALIGERGPEAVVPMRQRGAGMFGERSTRRPGSGERTPVRLVLENGAGFDAYLEEAVAEMVR
jgi:hypothetical protein